MLRRDLRQQQPPLPSVLDDEAVTTHLDLFGTGDALEWAENRHLEIEVGELRRGDAREPGVRAARGDR